MQTQAQFVFVPTLEPPHLAAQAELCLHCSMLFSQCRHQISVCRAIPVPVRRSWSTIFTTAFLARSHLLRSHHRGTLILKP